MSPNQATFDAIARDLKKYYFEDAVPNNTSKNQGLARIIIARYGSDVIIEGFLFAVLSDYLQTQPNMLALTYALNAMPNLYSCALDFVSSRNVVDATVMLASIVHSSSDEDVRAFAAMVLADPNLANPKILSMMQERFNQTEGTSCRIVIALLLCQCGDDRQLNAFIRDGYLPDYASTGKGMHMSKDELRRMTATMLAPQILKILFEDIATNGKGFNGPLGPSSKPWIRKRYD